MEIKIRFLILCLLIVVIALTYSFKTPSGKELPLESPMNFALYEDNHPTLHLQEIIEKTHIHTDGTLGDLIAQTQKSQKEGGWMRTQGTERWDLLMSDASDSEWYIDTFRQMGFIEEIKPLSTTYTYGVIFGATIQGMRERLSYLIDLITHRDIHVDTIVFLVGQRPRDEKRENIHVLFEERIPNIPLRKEWQRPNVLPQTETDLAYLIVDQVELPLDIKNRIIIVDTPMVQKSDGTMTRPTTDDTVRAWMDQHPKKGSVLCISSQPHVHRQGYVARRLLPPGWDIECVGSAASLKELTPSLLLDALARSLFELSKL